MEPRRVFIITVNRGYKMYEYNVRVGFSQTDVNHRMNLTAIIDAFQDCSCFHSEDLGVGFYYLQPKNLVWVINYWEVEFDRIPEYGEHITVGTYPYLFKSFLGHRNFYLKDEQGNMIVRANSLWTLMDWEKMRPSRPDEKIVAAYELTEKLDMEYNPRKIAIPEDANAEKKEQVIIQASHLDSNGHVNNGQYIKIAIAMIPQVTEYRRLRVEYRNQAHLGDVISPVVYSTEAGYVIALNDEEGNAYAVIELRY